MSLRRAALALLLATSALAGQAGEIRALGPLVTRSMFPLDLATLDMKSETAVLPRRGTTSLGLQLMYSNTFEITKNYDDRVADYESGVYWPGYDFNVDAETARAAFLAEYQLSRRIAVGIDLPLISHGGGFMDSIIEDVHDVLGLPQNDRELKEHDQINIDLLDGRHRALLDEDETAIGDVTLRFKAMLYDGHAATWTTVIEAKAPTGEEESLTGSGEWDFGLSFLVTAGGERHLFHGGLGHQFLGQPRTWPFEIEDRTSGFAGYEFRANDRWSIVAHVVAATSIIPDQKGYKQGDARADLVAGFHWQPSAFRLSVGFIENLTTNDNSADLGLVLQFGWQIGN